MTVQLDDSIKSVRVASLGATFSPLARERITEYLHSFVSFKPTLGLLYGAIPPDGSSKGSWSLTAYGAQTVDEMVELYAGFGSVVCYDLDGIRVCIPQLAHVDELEFGVLEFVGDRLSLVSSKVSL